MKKILLFLTLLLVNASFCYSQNLSVSWSPKQLTHNQHFDQALGHSNNKLFFTQKYQQNTFDFYNIVLAYKEIKTFAYSIVNPNIVSSFKYPTIRDFVFNDGHVYLIISNLEYEVGTSVMLYELSIGFEGDQAASVTGSGTELYKYGWAGGTNKGNVFVAKSDDRSKTVILSEHPIEKKKLTSTIGITVLEGASVTKTQTFELNLPSKKLTIYEPYIDNNGNVIVKIWYKAEKGWATDFFFLGKDDAEFSLLDLGVKEKELVQGIKLSSLDENRSVFIATMYDPEITGQNDFDHSANVISTIEISNGKPQPVKRTVFSDDFYKMYLQQEEKFEKWRRIDNSKIQAFHTFSNGDWVVIIEDGKIATQLVQVPASPGKPASSEKAYSMTYGNLGIFCFDGKTHQIKWEKALLKKQTQANRTGSTDQVSFVSANVNDHLHIFYNDMEKNGQPNWKSENGATIERNPNDGQFFPVSHQILDINGNSLVNAPLKGVYEPNFFSNDGSVRRYLRSYPTLQFEKGLAVMALTPGLDQVSMGIIGLE